MNQIKRVAVTLVFEPDDDINIGFLEPPRRHLQDVAEDHATGLRPIQGAAFGAAQFLAVESHLGPETVHLDLGYRPEDPGRFDASLDFSSVHMRCVPRRACSVWPTRENLPQTVDATSKV